MSMNRCRNCNGVDPRVLEQIAEFKCGFYSRIKTLAKRELRRIQIANGNHAGDIAVRKIANKVRAPIAVSDHSDAYQSVLHAAPAYSGYKTNKKLDRSAEIGWDIPGP